jgi:carboxyl-terminal processing protease
MTMLQLTEQGAFASFLVDVSLKASVILVIAWTLTLVLAWCRRSAALRHTVWALATVCVLALPMMTATLPTWRIAVPWQGIAPNMAALEEIVPTRSFVLYAPVPVEQIALTSVSEPLASSAASDVATEATAAAPQMETKRLPKSLPRLPWQLVVWMMGACVVVAPAALGLASLWRLARTSRIVTGGPLLVALRQAQEQLGVSQSVRLLETTERSMPMTWGIWRPTILLPQQANRWSQERVRIVLLHELAHCQRRDCLTRLVAQLARAVHWFNPLMWLAERQLRLLQEQACDDLVLSRGFDAADYADQLLAISASCRSRRWATGLALAMARTSNLERRLSMILDPLQKRQPLPRRWSGLAASAAIVALATLSSVRFEARAAAIKDTTQDAQSAPAAGRTTDHAQALAELKAKIAEQYYTSVDDNEMVQGAIRGMVSALDDPYSDYLTAEMLADIERQIGGTLVGIGAQLEMHEGKIRVVTPLENSPALKAGVRPGDVILQIDGQTTAGIELPEAVKRIVGQQGSSVRLKLGRQGGEEIELNVTRGPIQLQTVKGFQRASDNRWVFLLDPAQKIGYAQVAQLANNTPQELRAAIESMKGQGLGGLILDLRFCPGGTLDSAVAVAKLFLSEGTIVSIHGRDSEPMSIKVDEDGSLGDFPLIVLVNSETSSAAEIVAGALQDNERAIVLGTRSLGKGSVQSLIKLDGGGGAIKLTTSQYRLPNGRNIDRNGGAATWGINPNEGYFVPLDQAQTKAVLERRQAQEVIGGTASDSVTPPANVTSQWIVEELADPQLAAALKTLEARLTTGQFEKVSNLSPAEIELALKRDDVERRRTAVLQSLKELDQELASLDGEAAKN